MKPAQFDSVVFDMDGLLVDSERAIRDAWIAAAREVGVEIDPAEYLQRVVGCAPGDADRQLAQLAGGLEAFGEIRRRVIERIAKETDWTFPAKPGADALMHALWLRGIPCAVASSSSRGDVERRLGHVGLLRYVSAIAAGDEVARGKPGPAVYRLAVHRLSTLPQRSVAFEDSSHGIRAALSADLQAVAIPDLIRPAVDGCLAVLRSLGDALPLLDDWFGPVSRVGESD